MAVVTPINENRVEARPVAGARIRPAEFDTGQGIGRAVAQLGQTGMAAVEQQQENDIAYARVAAHDADNAATLERQALYYEGEGAFFNQQGRNALNAAPALQEARDRINREAEARLQGDPLAQEMYSDLAARRRASDNEAINRHLNTQRTAYENSVDESAVRVAAGTAANNWNNPAEVTRGITTAQTVAEQRARRMGLTDPEQIQVARQQAASIVVAQVAGRIELRSPLEALAFVNVHADQIDPLELTRLRDALDEPAAAEQADEGIGAFLVTTGGAPAEGAAAAPPAGSSATGPVRASGAAGTVAAALSAGGMSPNVVAGFLGNLQHESGFSASGSGDGGTAHGYGQWRAERVTNFQRVIGVHPRNATAAQQARFIVHEMANPREAGMTVAQRDAILRARTPEEAARLIDQFYERSDGQTRTQRAATARRFVGGTPATGGEALRPEIDLQGTIARINAPDARGSDGQPLTYPQRQALIAAASRRHGLVQQSHQEADQRLADLGYIAMNALGDNYRNYDQLPLTVRQQLGANPRLEYQFRAIAQTNEAEYQRELERRNNPTSGSQQFFDLFEAAQGNPQERAAFQRQDLRSPALNISTGERERLIGIQGTRRREQEGDAVRLAPNLDRINTYVSRIAGAALASGGASVPNVLRNRLLLTQRVADRVREQQTRTQQLVTDEQLVEIVASEIRPVTVVTRGWTGESRTEVPNYRSRSVAEANRNSYVRTETPLPDGVPLADATAIVQAYRAENRGANPSPETILQIYQRGQR